MLNQKFTLSGTGYLLRFILRAGDLKMWQSTMITQASLSIGEGPRYLQLDVFGKGNPSQALGLKVILYFAHCWGVGDSYLQQLQCGVIKQGWGFCQVDIC